MVPRWLYNIVYFELPSFYLFGLCFYRNVNRNSVFNIWWMALILVYVNTAQEGNRRILVFFKSILRSLGPIPFAPRPEKPFSSQMFSCCAKKLSIFWRKGHRICQFGLKTWSSIYFCSSSPFSSHSQNEIWTYLNILLCCIHNYEMIYFLASNHDKPK